MTKLYAMRGFSGSGKSHRAAEIAMETGAVIVNRDLLRLMLLGSYWTGKNSDENRVTVAEEAQVKALLLSGTSVVVDSTHLNPSYLRKWARLATRLSVGFEVVDVRTNKAACRMNDIMRKQRGEREVGKEVIDQQAKRWPMDKWPTITAEPFVATPVEYIDGLKDAIIVDIDGTLAHIPEGVRSPYDYTRVGDDDVDPTIRDLVNREEYGMYVLLVSGRDDTCRQDTLDWLHKHEVHYDHLFMRPTDMKDSRGNKAPDFIVKHELFNDHIRGKWNVQYVLDDRRQVIDMWRAMGLKVLDVAGNEF